MRQQVSTNKKNEEHILRKKRKTKKKQVSQRGHDVPKHSPPDPLGSKASKSDTTFQSTAPPTPLESSISFSRGIAPQVEEGAPLMLLGF